VIYSGHLWLLTVMTTRGLFLSHCRKLLVTCCPSSTTMCRVIRDIVWCVSVYICICLSASARLANKCVHNWLNVDCYCNVATKKAYFIYANCQWEWIGYETYCVLTLDGSVRKLSCVVWCSNFWRNSVIWHDYQRVTDTDMPWEDEPSGI